MTSSAVDSRAPSWTAAPAGARRADGTTWLAWGAIACFVLFTAGTLGVHLGRVAEFGYPVLAVLVGIVLLVVRPDLYTGFTIVLWLVSPFVRRVVDLEAGWNERSPVLVTPLAVAALCGFALLRHPRTLILRRSAPAMVATVGLVAGFVIGAARFGPVAATYALAQWLVPIIFGLWVGSDWRLYPQQRDRMRQTFMLGALILGLYGVWQFVNPPAWDRLWMQNAEMASIGFPEPFEVRVFSTINSPGMLATVLVPVIVGIIAVRSPVALLAALSGLVALALSLVRVGWGATVLGVGALVFVSRGLGRVALTLMAGCLLLLPLAATPEAQEKLLTRVQTLTDLSGDHSLAERRDFSRQASEAVIENPLGLGLGATGGATRITGDRRMQVFDNGALDILYSLGWVGGMLFMGGAIWAGVQAFRSTDLAISGLEAALRIIPLAMLPMLLSTNVLTGAGGITFWSCIGLAGAGRAFYARQPVLTR